MAWLGLGRSKSSTEAEKDKNITAPLRRTAREAAKDDGSEARD